MKQLLISSIAAIGAASAFAVSAVKPQINDLTVEQNGNRIVKITYKLANEPAAVTVDIQTNSLRNGAGTWASIGGENITPALSGDCCKLIQNGSDTRTIVWRPRVSWPNNFFKDGMAKAVVTAWATNEPPTFMVVDLTNTVQRFTYYADKSFLPGGITNRMYKTNKILFRRIPAAGVAWNMGSPSTEVGRANREDLHSVTLTEDYYMAVYETTKFQYELVKRYGLSQPGGFEDVYWPPADYDNSGYSEDYKNVCPVNMARFAKLRGTDMSLYNWPVNGHAVVSNRFFGAMRKMVGAGVVFDLPTEAQWEFAARAGTSTQDYFGNPITTNGSAKEYDTDGLMSANAWWYGNLEGIKYPREVGSKTANAFDLYDVIGNVYEACLDQYSDHLGTSAVIDPEGPQLSDADPYRAVRGGSTDGWQGGGILRSAARLGFLQNDDSWMWGHTDYGFRIWAPAVAK